MIAASPGQVLAELCACDSLVLLGHEDPDGDCVASQLALGAFLESRGKRVGIYSAGPFDRYEIRAFAPRFRTAIEAHTLRANPVAVLLDCASAERTGSLAPQLAGLRTVVIDHHPPDPDDTPFGDLRWVDPTAPAAGHTCALSAGPNDGRSSQYRAWRRSPVRRNAPLATRSARSRVAVDADARVMRR